MSTIPVDSQVRYWRGRRGKNEPSYIGRILSEPTKLGGTRGYYIRKENGGTDFIAATHVDLEPESQP